MGHNGVEALNLRADTNTWMLKQKFIQEWLGYQRWLWDGIFLGSQIPCLKSRDFWDFFPKKNPKS